MSRVERLLWYLNTMATVALLVRLAGLKLYQTYRFLYLFFLAQAAANLAMLPFSVHSDAYARIYYLNQTLSLILAICVVVELYSQALMRYPAMAEAGRRAVLILMSVTALVAASGVMLDSTIPAGQPLLVHRFFTFERTIDFMVLMFLLLMSGFLLWFPVKTKRNIVIYVIGFVLFYSSRSLGLLGVNLVPLVNLRYLSIILLAFSLVCLLLWTAGLRKESEDLATVTGHRSNAVTLERLSAQLDQINAALARFARNA